MLCTTYKVFDIPMKTWPVETTGLHQMFHESQMAKLVMNLVNNLWRIIFGKNNVELISIKCRYPFAIDDAILNN